jgi:penicillin-binding protein 1A
METALKSQPVKMPAVPLGLVQVGGEWIFDEYANGGGVQSLGLGDSPEAGGPDEKRKILDIFKN